MTDRVASRGKFLFTGGDKYYLRGVTYGTFGPDEAGDQYGDSSTVATDFARMKASRVNCVRTYTVPPRWFLDLAQENGLRVLVGLPWEQHIGFLDQASRVRGIEEKVRAGVRACAGHSAVLGYTIGNEIPSSIVRWYGNRPIERFLKRLYRIAKKEDPNSLVTYVNYPPTEYLHLPFLDFCCFNVYLEAPEALQRYLARVQNIAGNRPLVLAEIGLDSRRNGREAQADSLRWQLRMCFEQGTAGTFVFSWTDEWYRGGFEIEDWDFGLVTRERTPKPALLTVREAYANIPLRDGAKWPSVSVVVCTYNGAPTLEECLDHVKKLDYPNFEVIVVDDGSTDDSAAIAERAGVRLIRVKNGGLSRARNIGWQASKSEIIAYTDDDAYPDPHWLRYLAAMFLRTDYSALGGPNIPPPDDGLVADAVGYAPGGPSHVLFDDTTAEHIPGCNMAFRRSHLAAIDGFDPQFRVAGDDVDLCWRLQERGWKLGFCPPAVVWHHRRGLIGTYWKQQKGYGKAETLLEQKWPEKYNVIGHPSWHGRVYGPDAGPRFACVSRIYQGTWGMAPFQSVYQSPPELMRSFPLMPEWILITALLGVLGLLGFSWPPMFVFAGLFAVATFISTGYSVRAALASTAAHPYKPRRKKAAVVLLTTLFNFMQPTARLWGRIQHGITPWRIRGLPGLRIPLPIKLTLWSERWHEPEFRLGWLEKQLWSTGVVVLRGGGFDRWDLEVRSGFLGAARLRMAVEEHGGGRQLWRLRAWPKLSSWGVAVLGGTALLSALAFAQGGWVAGGVLAAGSVVFVARKLQECMWAMNAVAQSFDDQRQYEASLDHPTPPQTTETTVDPPPSPLPAGSESPGVGLGARSGA